MSEERVCTHSWTALVDDKSVCHGCGATYDPEKGWVLPEPLAEADLTYAEAVRESYIKPEIRELFNHNWSEPLIQIPGDGAKYSMLPAEKAAYRMAMLKTVMGTISWIAFLITVALIFRWFIGS